MTDVAPPCPCGSGRGFTACCGPILAGAPAATPEALMRSRYTAFSRGDVDHLRATWHPGTLPEDLALHPEQTWIGLEILDAPPAGPDDKRGIVEFRARCRYRGESEDDELHERSRFVKQSGRWWYLDGTFPAGA